MSFLAEQAHQRVLVDFYAWTYEKHGAKRRRSRFYSLRTNTELVNNVAWIADTVEDVAKLGKFRYNFFDIKYLYVFMKATKEKNRYSRENSAVFRVDISSFEPKVKAAWFLGNDGSAKMLSWEWKNGRDPSKVQSRSHLIEQRAELIPMRYIYGRRDPFVGMQSVTAMYAKNPKSSYAKRSGHAALASAAYPKNPRSYYSREETKTSGMPGKFGYGARKTKKEMPAY